MKRLISIVVVLAIVYGISQIFTNSPPSQISNGVTAEHKWTSDQGQLDKAIGNADVSAASKELTIMQADIKTIAETENSPNHEYDSLTTQMTQNDYQYLSDVSEFLLNPTQNQVEVISSDVGNVNQSVRKLNTLFSKLGYN